MDYQLLRKDHHALTDEEIRSADGDRFFGAFEQLGFVGKNPFREEGGVAVAVLRDADDGHIGRADDGMAISFVDRIKAGHVE